MKRMLALLLSVLLLLNLCAAAAAEETVGQNTDAGTETPTEPESPTRPEPEPEPTPAETPPPPAETPMPTATADPAPTATAAVSPTAPAEPTAAPIPTATATAAPTPGLTPAPTVTPLPTTTPESTITPGVSPTPDASSTPDASPTPEASPSPTPTPSPALTAEAKDVRVALANSEFTLLDGITILDEYKKPIPCRVLDSGGFDIRVPGDYTVTYWVRHPLTGEEFTFTRVITVYKTPAQESMTLTFVLPEITLKVGTEAPSLSEGAYALDENGRRVEAALVSSASIDMAAPAVHSIRYTAIHPLSGERFYGERTVRVLSEEEYRAYERANRPPAGTSSERYARYMAYRNEVAEELQPRMAALTAALQARIDAVARAVPGAEPALYRAVPLMLDDSGADESLTIGQAEAANRSPYPVDGAGMERMDALSISNWTDILAVFVAQSALDVDEPLDLVNLRKIPLDGLEGVFWDMLSLSYHEQDGALRLMLTERTAEEAAEAYGFTDDQLAMLNDLLQPEFQKVFASLTGDSAFAELSDEERAEILADLPENLTLGREKVVLTAYSLVDKLTYFWGGKHNEVGWNPLWGIPRRVTSQNSPTTGTLRPYGLDCSGFVSWTFINAAEDPAVLSAIGNGSGNQWSRSTSLGWDEAQPGDLAFRAVPGSVRVNHVGIVVSKEADGSYLIAHCSSSRNAVVVTEAWSSGFRYLRRPVLYDSMEVRG